MAKVELTVGFASVTLVDANKLPVAWIQGKEAPGRMAALKDHIVSACMLEEICHLQARGASPNDTVVMVQGISSPAGGQTEGKD